MDSRAVVLFAVLFFSPISLYADLWNDVVEKSRDVASDIVGDVAEQVSGNSSAVDQGADGVKAADIDGVSLGMGTEEANAVLESNGYELDRCASQENSNTKLCYSDLLGVTVKGEKSGGYEQITYRHMDGKVYWFSKRITYIPRRHMPKDKSIADLKQDYYDKYTQVFDTRYFEQYGTRQTYHFDDEAPPPYNRKLTSPHAVLTLNDGRGTLIVGIDMEWKGLVGASW